MKYEKVLSLLLALALVLCMTGCVTVQEVTEPSATETGIPQEDTDWGRTEFFLGEGSFRTGQSLSHALDTGLTVEEGDPALVLEPWAHRFFTCAAQTDYGPGTVELGVVNNSEESRPAQACTIYYIFTDCSGITTDKGLTIGISSDAETLTALDRNSTSDLILGHYTSFATYDVFFDTLYSVEVLHLQDYLGPIQTGDGLIEAVLAKHTDWSSSYTQGLLDYSGNLSENLGLSRLQMTLEGLELTFGAGGTTLEDLQNAGWVFPGMDAAAIELEPGECKDGILPEQTGYSLRCGFTNYSDQPLPLAACSLSQLELVSPADGSPQSRDFEFCGVTPDTNLSQIAQLLGEPHAVNSYAAKLWLFTMYNFEDQNGNSFPIHLDFDMLTGQLLSFIIG